LREDIISLIIHAEHDYHDGVKKAIAEAEAYADERKKKQIVYVDWQKREWERFEKSENAKLEKKLAAAEQRLEKETAEMKNRLKTAQEKKVNQISERLKEEVLSLYGNR